MSVFFSAPQSIVALSQMIADGHLGGSQNFLRRSINSVESFSTRDKSTVRGRTQPRTPCVYTPYSHCPNGMHMLLSGSLTYTLHKQSGPGVDTCMHPHDM